MKLLSLLALFVILLIPKDIHHFPGDRLIIWNVGQGQWVTYSSVAECIHFDLGGEFFAAQSLKKECGTKQNRLFMTHLDWDHISFLTWSRRSLKNFCLDPQSSLKHFEVPPKRTSLFKSLKPCEQAAEEVKGIKLSPHQFKGRGGRPPRLSPNDLSLIWILKEQVLITGDSTSRAERIWITKLPNPQKIEVLILGHHGSRTSTHPTLLKKLPKLRLAVASARKEVYGHPHHKVRLNLKRSKVPLLVTQEWGDIRLEL